VFSFKTKLCHFVVNLFKIKNLQRLVEEFKTQETTVKDMEDQIVAYNEAGQAEAAIRLQEQLSLLNVKFTMLFRNTSIA
jgi:hypothetical protein